MKSLLSILALILLMSSCNNSSAQNNSSSYDIGNEFIPAGYMGCINNINMNNSYLDEESNTRCFKIEFASSCPDGFAGVYWTNDADDSGANWGQSPGTDLSNKNFTKVTFWAKGSKGNESVEFGTGGLNSTNQDPNRFKYKDSYSKKRKKITLTDKWQQYSIDITGSDLSSVIGGFFWVADWRANTTGVIFYLRDIKFE